MFSIKVDILSVVDSETSLGNVIIFTAGRTALESLTWSYNGYEYVSLNVLYKCKQPSLPKYVS